MIPLMSSEDILFALIILAIMCSPAIVMTILGFAIQKKYPNAAKILFILSVINVIVSCGLCGQALTEPFSIH